MPFRVLSFSLLVRTVFHCATVGTVSLHSRWFLFRRFQSNIVGRFPLNFPTNTLQPGRNSVTIFFFFFFEKEQSDFDDFETIPPNSEQFFPRADFSFQFRRGYLQNFQSRRQLRLKIFRWLGFTREDCPG